MNNTDDTQPVRPRKTRKRWFLIGSILLGVTLIGTVLYLALVRPLLNAPINEPMDLISTTEQSGSESDSKEGSSSTNQEETPLCGDENEWVVLVVGTDYREGDYLYGLADAIRIVRIDFTTPIINVVALPRALLIETPGERLDVEAPILLNQAYLFGAEGMGHYTGSGYGAGSLAETIQTNFDIPFDHYVIMDFYAFKNFIYLIGGIQIDLPESIYINETEELFFPAGFQILDGEQALQLARARAYTSDNQRIDNQTLILKAIFNRLKDPGVLKYLPELVESLKNSVLTDASFKDIQNVICLIDKLSADQIQFFNPDAELIESTHVFIPTMNNEMEVFLWDQDLIDWVQSSLWAEQIQ